MEVNALAGSAWGVPVRGAVVSLADADVSSILTASAGLAKGLFFAGSALAVAAVSLFAKLQPKVDALSWGTLAKVQTWDDYQRHYTRQFRGVCLTREIRIISASHNFDIPVEYIKDYHPLVRTEGFFSSRTKVYVSVTLFDGSSYNGVLLGPDQFEFLTPLGKQFVPVSVNHSISGCTVTEAKLLRTNMETFLKNEARTAESLLGAEQFQRFFMPKI
jgi:hypothetical protein